MKIISKTKVAIDVNRALEEAVKEMNEELKMVDGIIAKSECDVSAGPSGASVSITFVVNGTQPYRKEVAGVNVKGVSRDHSMKKAIDHLNALLQEKKGEIADLYIKTIVTPFPGRVYTTAIAAINEEVLEEAHDADIRRSRIRRSLELLNNDPSALNIASVAQVFGVSRTMIYKDLEALGFKRTALKGEEEPASPESE
jgi:hypothetical protein